MEYVVKNEQNELVRLTVVSGLPMLPEGFELVGLESEVNPNGLDLSLSKIEIQTIIPEQQVLVQAEILAVEAQAEKWTKEGEADLFVDPQDETWAYVPAVEAVAYQPAIYNTIPAVMGPRVVVDAVKSATKTKTAQIQTAYDLMNSEVLAQMVTVFGTTKPESATANQQTWQLMLESPELFVPSKFATEAEVLAYANDKMVAVRAYAVWREARIDQFRTERQNILNS